MDIGVILSTAFEFLKMLALLTVAGFVLYKIFAPVRDRLAERFHLSWIKSTLLFNFLAVFVVLLVAFIYFMAVGNLLAPQIDPDLQYNLLDNFLLVLISSGRLLVAALIIALPLLFFELVAGFFMTTKEFSEKNKQARNTWASQLTGIVISSAIFLVLILFVFDWVPLGLFVFIFYGSIKPLPLALFHFAAGH